MIERLTRALRIPRIPWIALRTKILPVINGFSIISRLILKRTSVTLICFVLFWVSLFLLGTKTFGRGESITQQAITVSALIKSTIAVGGPIGIIWLVTTFLKEPFGSWIRRQKRRGSIALFFLLLTIPLLASYALLPKPKTPIEELFSLLSTSRENLQAGKAFYERFAEHPAYKETAAIKLAEKVIEYRETKQLPKSDYATWANLFQKYYDHELPVIRNTAERLGADALDRLGKKTEADNLYFEIAKDSSRDSYTRWWAFNEVGVRAYMSGDYRWASRMFSLAIEQKDTRAVRENLALCFMHLRNWEKAEEQFLQAEKSLNQFMRENDLASMYQQRAILHTNWARMYLSKSTSPISPDEKAEALTEAEDHVERAIELDDAYLDAYWLLVGLKVNQGDYSDAKAITGKVKAILGNPKKYEIDRLGYDKHGSQYNCWKLIEIEYSDPATAKITPETINYAQEVIPGFDADRASATRNELELMRSDDWEVQEDLKLIENTDFLRFLNAP